jgi:hypothetical protein
MQQHQRSEASILASSNAPASTNTNINEKQEENGGTDID